jgi:hypothetical protein
MERSQISNISTLFIWVPRVENQDADMLAMAKEAKLQGWECTIGY